MNLFSWFTGTTVTRESAAAAGNYVVQAIKESQAQHCERAANDVADMALAAGCRGDEALAAAYAALADAYWRERDTALWVEETKDMLARSAA